jgi:arylsulfatase A-like enzyme
MTSAMKRAVGALLLLASMFFCSEGSEPPPLSESITTPPNARSIVLITIDTLRADHLEAYGYQRATAPNIADLASDGTLFENAISEAPWTLPSISTLVTSLYPSRHGVQRTMSFLTPEAWTVGEALSGVGYRTTGVTSFKWVGPRRGFAQGFDHFELAIGSGRFTVSSGPLTDRAIHRLRALAAGPDPEQVKRPFLLWVHYFDPHINYVRHPEYEFAEGASGPFERDVRLPRLKHRHKAGRLNRTDVAYIEGVYDEEISHVDTHVGRLLSEVSRLGLDDDDVIALTAGRGGERGELRAERRRAKDRSHSPGLEAHLSPRWWRLRAVSPRHRSG